jgi:hypothetical protein
LELKICREKAAEMSFFGFPGESSKLSISLMEEGNLTRLSSNNGWF